MRHDVAGGFYLAYAPPDWDGVRPLPALMYFQGYRESAAGIMANADVTRFAAQAGLLLIVPHGEGQTWSHPGSPTQSRDEFAFVESVLADVTSRWPLDKDRLWTSGFSQGAAMVWNLACHRGHLFAAYLPIAGAFWQPEPETCPSGAQHIRHIHGLADVTVPLAGRPIRNGQFHQGDVRRAIAMMQGINKCDAALTRIFQIGALTCEVMGGCTSGRRLEFCLHPGGHDFDPRWLEEGWAFTRALPPRP